jgi:glycosyltransferase involved in cell wall biosynthesis
VAPRSPSRSVATRLRRRLAQWDREQELARFKELIEAREHRRTLERVRAGRDVCWEDAANPDPLVTIRIGTFRRAEALMQTSLPSALRQTWTNLEVLVIGDHTDEATDDAMSRVTDPRVRYLNLPRQGRYPDDETDRWCSAGTHPWNVALHLARGSWIAPLDDDDELTDDHVEVLLRHAQQHRLEMVYSKARLESAPGVWSEVGEAPLTAGGLSHGSVLYSLGLDFLRYNESCHLLREPNDWNLWRRMQRAGVRMGFLDRVTYVHNWSAHELRG